ncbi:hypothetical protein LshimejAT787_0310590 [Lyophyllum shimeji]|uniref:Uncharacterized protein n=1 Tax=Lyophyllum shimeji TaxID=47721 RepID=A0A9P3PIG1_LYOSH|nr:hypothetical protein LshimejAT787_0310590 [Lyophyllum shimeji]
MTELSITAHPWPNLLDALVLCESLQRLTISVDGKVAKWAHERTSRLTLQVKFFTLVVGGQRLTLAYAGALLNSLNMPAATTMRLVRWTGDRGTWPSRALVAFLARAVSLSRLEIISVPLADGVLEKCLATIPQLEHLHFRALRSYETARPGVDGFLVNNSVAASFLRALEVTSSPGRQKKAKGPILPNLTSLTLQDPFGDFNPQSVLYMINSRLAHTAPGGTRITALRHLVLHSSHPPKHDSSDPEHLSNLRWLETVKTQLPEGLDLTISCPSNYSEVRDDSEHVIIP